MTPCIVLTESWGECMKFLIVFGALSFALTATAQNKTQNIAETKKYLKQFYQNPGVRAKVMDQRLVKKNARTGKALPALFYGTQSNVVSKGAKDRLVTQKNLKRNARFKGKIAPSGKAGFSTEDDFMNLVDNGKGSRNADIPPIRSIEGMEKYLVRKNGAYTGASKNLTSATLKASPWSDDYWAIAAGILANRYGSPAFKDRIGGTSEKGWKKVNDYISDSSNSCSVKELSPAEKYDLLVGDQYKTLTMSMLQQGREYFYDLRNDTNKDGKVDDTEGKVETWMGICHGWAPAAYMVVRPKAAINVKAADGKTVIPFYPADIKALASLLWASGNVNGQKFIGGRCNTKESEIKKDPKNNRVIDQQCFDTNPGTWHLAIVNQIGVSERSMVLDATFDYEVWNQPIYSYSYNYFKPGSSERVGVPLASALIPISEYKNDPFNGKNPATGKPYRDPRTKYIVGISMDVSYIVETKPSQKTPDTAAADARKSVNYVYDLELDEKKNIIGGEWYNNRHPDFLWTPSPKAIAYTSGDAEINRKGFDKLWKDPTKNALPIEWANEAIGSSREAPLYYIVTALAVQANLLGPDGE